MAAGSAQPQSTSMAHDDRRDAKQAEADGLDAQVAPGLIELQMLECGDKIVGKRPDAEPDGVCHEVA